MDPKRKARRSSILKTRNDGGSGDLNLENVGKDTLSGNLTGILPKRRVSFCHTNQVKEFENTNSSTEGSLSKTTDFNQTMCDEMNMSVSMLDVTNDIPPDYEKTHCAENDMSFDGENLVTRPRNRKSTRLSVQRTSQDKPGPEMSFHQDEAPIASVVSQRLSQSKQIGNKTMNVNQTMCPDMNMSVTMLDTTKVGHQDFDKTRFVENDMSFDQTGILPKRRVSICPTNQLKESEKTNSSTERSLSKTMNTNQTMCPDMNMSVSMLDEANDNPQDYEKTRFVENDMSFDQTGILPRRRVSICPTNQVKQKNNTNSNTERSLSKTMNSNQTMCPDMNMSVSMLDATKAVHQDYDKTRCGETDMSFDGESRVTRKSTRLSTLIPSQRRLERTVCTEVNDMSLENAEIPIVNSVAHTFIQNQSKQFGNKTMNVNQTMCPDMNMSVSMLDATKAGHQDYDKTRCAEKDMSFDGESRVTRKSTRLSTLIPSQRRLEKTVCTEVNDMSLENAEIPVASTEAHPFSQKQTKQIGNKTMNINQTVCADMNMSVTMLDATKAFHQDYDKTRCGEKDMSFDGGNQVTRKSTRLSTRRASEQGLSRPLSTEENDMPLESTDVPVASAVAQPLSQPEACFKPTECKVNPTVTVTDKEARQYHEKPRSTPMVFHQPNPENFLNPLGNGITMKRPSQMKESQNKLSFGQFGSSKTPKRNKIASIVPPKPQQHQKVKMTNDANVQTSPMVQAPPLKKTTQEVGFNCTLGAIDTREFADASLMTSPAYFSAPKSQQTNPEEKRESPKMESVGVGTSIIMTSPASFSAPTSQQTTPPSKKEAPKMESVGVGTSIIMISPANLSAPKSQQTNAEKRESLKMESMGVGTSIIMTSPVNFSAPKTQQTNPEKRESPKMESMCEGTPIIITSPASFSAPTPTPPAKKESPKMESTDVETSIIMTSPASFSAPTPTPPAKKESPKMGSTDVETSIIMTSPASFSAPTSKQTNPPAKKGSPKLESTGVETSIIMASPVNSSAPKPKSQQTNLEKRESPKMECVGVDKDEGGEKDKEEDDDEKEEKQEDKDHSFVNRNGNRESQDIKQAETLRSIAVDSSQFNMSQVLDQSSVLRQSEKTHDGIVEESYFFETTLPMQPPICAAPTPAPLQIPKACEDEEVSLTSKAASTPGFSALLEKLNEYATTSDLELFEKWGFLRYAMDKLARIADHEWQDVLGYEKIKEFLGQDYIKAVNTHRKRLSSKDPMYVGSMKYAAEMKKKGIPLA